MDAAVIICNMCLRSCGEFSHSDVLLADHDAKFTSEVFCPFVKSVGSCLIVYSAYHKNNNANFVAKVERSN